MSPRVIAVTHLFTLGWIATSIFGALYQLFPVILGIGARSERVAFATLAALQAGIVMMAIGSWWWRPWMLTAGWLALATAVGGLAWNLLPQRRKAPRGRRIGLYVSAAHSALGLAMFVVAARIGQAAGWWESPRLAVLTAHTHLAALGFATMTVVGVSSQLLPMFLLSQGHVDWPMRWIGPLLLGGVVAHAAGALTGLPALSLAGGGVAAGGACLFLRQAASWFAHRTRRDLDPGMAHVALALLVLGFATAAGIALLLDRTFRPGLVTAYGALVVLGWLTVFTAGIYYRIIPFLTWMNRFAGRVGQPGLPRVADLTLPALGWITLALFASGTVGLTVGVLRGSAAVGQAAAWTFAAALWLVVAQHARTALLALAEGRRGNGER